MIGDSQLSNDEATTPTPVLNISIAGDVASLSNTPPPRIPLIGVPDGKVDMVDLGSIARRFGGVIPNPGYDPNLDARFDGKIDMKDIAVACKNYGRTDP